MKKLLIFLSLVFFFNVPVNASQEPVEISFIYINGSNNLAYNNRLKFKTAFIADVEKLHPQIMAKFEQDKLIKENFLQNGRYVINPTPIPFYWGDRSLDIVETLDRDLNSASKYSSRIAHQARTIFAHCLHDAVWVQKPQNMSVILEDLHKVVNAELAKGKKVVLLGYSAGSFVTYQYYMNKSNSIVPAEIALGRFDKEIENYIVHTPVNPTCFDALVDADLIKYNIMSGLYELNKNQEYFKKNYANLDKYTELSCFKGGSVKGVVGFASPARLFYSDLLNEKTGINKISLLMAKSIIENDVFYLTVNYSNDPFGFSNSENFTYKNLQNNLQSFMNKRINKGFIYNKSNNYVPRTFITAHLAYWDTPKRFAKAIVKAYNEGYYNFYGIER